MLSPQQANWVLRKSKETQSVSEPSPSESENSYEPSLLNNSGYDAAFVTHHISASPNQGSEYSDVRNKKHDFISKQKFFENLADFKIDYSSKFGLDILGKDYHFQYLYVCLKVLSLFLKSIWFLGKVHVTL